MDTKTQNKKINRIGICCLVGGFAMFMNPAIPYTFPTAFIITAMAIFTLGGK